MLEKSENGGAPTLQNLQNLEKGGFDGFVGTPRPRSQDCEGGFVGFVGTPDPRLQKSKPAMIDAKTIMVEAWTPAGTLMMVPAESAEHAAWIDRMNPPPIPAPMVQCSDCQHAAITNGIASCAAGVESGLPIGGFWASDRHLCESYWGISS